MEAGGALERRRDLDRIGGDLDALVAYVAAHSQVSPPALDRITQAP